MFKRHFHDASRPICTLHRNHIVERYCSIELREYRRIFRSNDEVRALFTPYEPSRTDRHWHRLVNWITFHVDSPGSAGFSRITKRNVPLYSLPHGKSQSTSLLVSQTSPGTPGFHTGYLRWQTNSFRYRDDMVAALSKASSSLTVTLLLETLRQTLDFEQSIATKFGMSVRSLAQLCLYLLHG